MSFQEEYIAKVAFLVWTYLLAALVLLGGREKILSRERCFEFLCLGVFRRNTLPKAFRATLLFFQKKFQVESGVSSYFLREFSGGIHCQSCLPSLDL